MNDRNKPTEINQKRFVRLFKDTLVQESSMRFCFLLGIGASRSSGIQTQSDLIIQWFDEISEDLESHQLQDWLSTTGINKSNTNQHAQDIIKKRFEFEPDICDKVLYQHSIDATPGLGYSILAQILDRTQHNLVITCNSDYLIEDALFTIASKAPLQLRYLGPSGQTISPIESIQQIQRPMVFRIGHETNECDNEIETSSSHQQTHHGMSVLNDIIASFRTLLIGHSGNQDILLHYLSQLPKDERQPLFWCTCDVNSIHDSILSLLTPEDYIVEIEGFDELMFQIIDSFSESTRTKRRNKSIISLDYFGKEYLINQAHKKDRHYKSLISELIPDTVVSATGVRGSNTGSNDTETLPRVNDEIDNLDQFDDFMDSLKLSSSKLDDSIYRQALEKDPSNARYNTQYAIFLEDSGNTPSEAAQYFDNAIRSAPRDEKIKTLYAYLLHHHMQDYDAADKLYNDAYLLAPDNVAINILFGIFLHNIRKKYMAAEENFKTAYKATENDMDYTDFIKGIRMDYKATGIYYKKSLEEAFISIATDLPADRVEQVSFAE